MSNTYVKFLGSRRAIKTPSGSSYLFLYGKEEKIKHESDISYFKSLGSFKLFRKKTSPVKENKQKNAPIAPAIVPSAPVAVVKQTIPSPPKKEAKPAGDGKDPEFKQKGKALTAKVKNKK